MKHSLRIKSIFSRLLSPERIFILSFAGLIVVGASLLWSPFSATRGHLSVVDALFSSASAVCVTGLTVIDIGRDLSFAGQLVTVFLFQIGGLGIITFSTLFFVLMGRGIPTKEREILQSTFMHTPGVDFFGVLKSILLSTFIFESVGVLVLWSRFAQDDSPGRAFYLALYHAISAFNNCGYTLFSDSLIGYQGDLVVNVTVMGLIILGGIGFIVQYELFARIRGRQRRLSVHTKIVLMTTGILVLAGAALFYVFERDRILEHLPFQTQLLASFFQSITPRTAGFNTVDISHLANQTILTIMVLMFIGASPGSTGGGVKTTSAGLLFLLMLSRLRGNEEVHIFNRTIPRELINRTISIILASVFSIFFITSLLLFAAQGDLPFTESRRLFVEYLFETISAFGTVGLSMNVTPTLNDFQKIATILIMFAGRVGPLTLAFSLSRSMLKTTIRYAEEGVMVG
jgi:trk system potassium uptake protein TrkH